MEKFFVPCYIPPYSCRFNSVEGMWNVMKHNIRNGLMHARENLDYDQWRQLITRSWDAIPVDVADRMVESNRGYLQ